MIFHGNPKQYVTEMPLPIEKGVHSDAMLPKVAVHPPWLSASVRHQTKSPSQSHEGTER